MQSRYSCLSSAVGILLLSCGPSQQPSRTAAPSDASELQRPSTTPAQAAVAPLKAEPAKVKPAQVKQSRVDESELTEPRIGALEKHVWIKPKPSQKGLALGNLRFGMSIKLKTGKAVRGDGCPKGWYEVMPRGYVCLNGRTTLNLRDTRYQALHSLAPRHGSLWPYRYAHSRGAPMYSRVPTPAEWKKAEARLGKPGTYAELGLWAKGHEEMIEKDVKIQGNDPVPWFFEGGKRHVGGGHMSVHKLVWRHIPNGSMLAYAKAFTMHGRVWLVTPDLMIVPADRVQYLRRSKFRGINLVESKVKLPVAWNRHLKPRPIYQKNDKGKYVDTGERLAGKAWVEIDAKQKGLFLKGYYKIRKRPGHYLHAKDITVSWQRKKYPHGIRKGESWIDLHITPGTLTAYDALTPVYATLFSPGKGGQPVKGNDHTVYATTQTGYFRLEWKEWVATMSNEKGAPTVLWFSDVPHVQYIKAPLAMHVAYWHEDYGKPKSAECVNLAPFDGRWLFGWTDPKPPEGWGAISPGRGFGKSTPFMINGF